MITKTKIMARFRHPAATVLDDFEERLMFGDLSELIADLKKHHETSEDMVHGLEGLDYFRRHYGGGDQKIWDRGRVAALDAAWCMELITLARRERAGNYYRA
ncbi:MAG: hypothetical protein EBZ69_02080 [Alphaproteobacteria bacterium]|nr:hypothetical protein [Alphaproteobacteria bacterium]NDG04390.1 hypothetical protein [Alphaproteobacteria bacterium]